VCEKGPSKRPGEVEIRTSMRWFLFLAPLCYLGTLINGFLLTEQFPSSTLSPSTLSPIQDACEAKVTHLRLFPKNIEAFLLGTTDACDEDTIKENDDPHKVLAEYQNLASGHQKDITQAQASLLSYLVRWARLLEKDESLTTPVLCGTSEDGGFNISFRKAPR
jgi:hypothetical protein